MISHTRESPDPPRQLAKAAVTAPHGQAENTPAWLLHGAVIVLSLILALTLYVLARRGGFFVDDWLNLARARHNRLSWNYLSINSFGHFSPGFLLVFMEIQRHIGNHYQVTLGLTVALFALTLLLMYRLLLELVGRHWWTVVLVLVYGCSAVWFNSTFWLAAAISILIPNFLVLLGVDAYIRWIRRHQPLNLVVAIGSMIGGLAFSEKALLMPLYFLLLALLVLEPVHSLDQLGLLLKRRWWLWTSMAVIDLAYIAFYFHAGYGAASSTRPGPRLLVEYLGASWLYGVMPSVVGGPWNWTFAYNANRLGVFDSPWPLLVGAQLLALAVVATTAVRNRQAWRGWAFAGVSLAANLLVVAWGRAGLYGLGPTHDPRYVADATFLVVIGAALALGAKPEGARSTPRALRTPAVLHRYGLRAATATLSAVVVAVFGVSAAAPSRNWSANDHIDVFFARINGDLVRLRGGGAISVADRVLPPTVYGEAFFNPTLAELLPIVAPQVTVVPPGTAGAYVVDDDGSIRPPG